MLKKYAVGVDRRSGHLLFYFSFKGLFIYLRETEKACYEKKENLLGPVTGNTF